MDAKRTAKDKVMSFLIECDSWPTGRTIVIEGHRVTFFEKQAEWQTGSESVDVIYKAEVDKCTLSQALKPVAHYATHTNESRSDFFAAIDGKPWLILSNGDYVKCTFELDDLIALPTAEHPVPKHYTTPADKIVEHYSNRDHETAMKLQKKYNGMLSDAINAALKGTLDATSNAPDEWPSETEKAAMDAAMLGTGFMLNGKRVDPEDVFIDVPETGEWVDGFPPLKTDFEASLKNADTWFSVKAKAFSDDYVVFETSGTEWAALKSDYEFRPIETPAQAEEREREEAVVEVAEIIMAESGVSDGYANIRAAATRIVELLSTDQLKDKSDE